MPPANSPTDTTPTVDSPSSPSPFLQQLEIISTPVLDLAATLMNHPEDAIHDQNVRFLRTRRESNEERRHGTPRSRGSGWNFVSESSGSGNPDGNGTSRPQTTTRSSDRVPIVRRRNLRAGDYREPPPQHSQSVYGWAPDFDDDDDDDLDDFSSGLLHRMWHSRESARLSGRTSAPSYESMREPSSRTSRPVNSEQEGRRNPPSRYDLYGDSALVTAALLQSARRHPRFSTSRIPQNQAPDSDTARSRNSTEDEMRRPFAATHIHNPHTSILTRGDLHRHPELRRMYLKDPSVDRLKETIHYLDRVRFSNSYEESVSSAAAGGFVQLDYFLSNEDDFILNTNSIAPPAECSWLKPGTVFSGHQQATHSSSPSMLSHRVPGSNRLIDPVIVNGNENNRITVYTSSGRRYWAHSTSDLSGGSTDEPENSKMQRWPVKVTIHDIDYSTMTLSGTMEAYNIPDKTATNQSAHIITFLEGEIIDFHTHTLETKNFNASPEVDSCYWRELAPFQSQTPDEIVKSLVSKKWLSETLAKGWILMRWKERCFVSPSHSRQGLTISGFYYISIRREDGHIAGMYYDPGSSPYQELTLNPVLKERMAFPAYSFR
ncbi:hypothetical protein D8B26_003385 [Coccidioides posadasii str. Silveira]|uniref:Uncharacterized protein n=2 Tax=Coccidioides posadasii (strain RMSCC 757 / Silveira) TaxID=443226 RepID=E9CZS7_COCPS|nr:conserved hypothetical protein [Coccidioides posadasii str. Silveira]QVM08708.1 hypothetical protein D8B26_003385 [Coccidioides posadasii str. Silveira]